MSEENGTVDVDVEIETGASEAEELEVTATDEDAGGEEPEKLYTKAELDAIAEKTRKATERKLQRRYEREMQSRQQAETPQPTDFNPENVPKKDGETDAQWIARIAKLSIQHDRLEAEKAASAQKARSAIQDFEAARDDFYDRAEALPGFDKDEFAAYVLDLDLSDGWADAIVSMEGGEKVAAYYLDNPKEFARLEKLSEWQQVMDIGRVQAKLEKQIKQAADPMAQVKGGSVNNRKIDQLSSKEIEAMPLKEFEARLKKEGGGRWL